MNEGEDLLHENAGQPLTFRIFMLALQLDAAHRTLLLNMTGQHWPEETCEAFGLLQANDDFNQEEAEFAVRGTRDPIAAGNRFENLQIVETIAENARSLVLRVRNTKTNAEWVVKQLKERPGDTVSRAAMSETHNLARIRHPYVVNVVDVGQWDGLPAILMEFVQGTRLDTLIEEGGFRNLAERLQPFLRICDGLSGIHRAGFLHGDIKPQNIMVTEAPSGPGGGVRTDRGVKLLDLGATVPIGTIPRVREISEAYAPPWAADTSTIDLDIYPLGIVLKELLSTEAEDFGHVPAWRRAHAAAIYRAATTAPAENAERFADVAQLRAEVKGLLDLKPSTRVSVRSRPLHRLRLWIARQPVIASLVAILICSTVVWSMNRERLLGEVKSALHESEERRNTAYTTSEDAMQTVIGILSLKAELSGNDVGILDDVFHQAATRTKSTAATLRREHSPDWRTRDLAFLVSTTLRQLGELDESETLLRQMLAVTQPEGISEKKWVRQSWAGKVRLAEVLIDRERTKLPNDQKLDSDEIQDLLSEARRAILADEIPEQDVLILVVLSQRQVDSCLTLKDLEGAGKWLKEYESDVGRLNSESLLFLQQSGIVMGYKGELVERSSPPGQNRMAEAKKHYVRAYEFTQRAYEKDPNSAEHVPNLGRAALRVAKMSQGEEKAQWLATAEKWTSEYRTARFDQSAILELWGVWFRMLQAAPSKEEKVRLKQKIESDYEALPAIRKSKRLVDFYSRLVSSAGQIIEQTD